MSKNETAANIEAGTVAPGLSAGLGREDSGRSEAAGDVLKNARLSQCIGIDTLAGLLKVPVHKLHALEQGHFEALPDPVFTRALAASMCRILKLDPAPVLQGLPAILTFKATPQNRGINTPFRTRNTRNSRQAAPLWSHISRPAIWLGIALLMGALVLLFLPFIEQEIARLRPVAQLDASPVQPADPVPATTTVVTPVVRYEGAPAAAQISAADNPAAVDVFAAVPGPALPPASSAMAQAAAADPVSLLNFSAKGASYVKVTDANGAVVFDRVLRSGESVGLSATPPLAAVVGRANAISVLVRGAAFDIAAVSKNNIARFEVK